MEFIDKLLLKYCEDNSASESPALQKLNRYTHANVLQPRMLSGHLQGRFLSMLSKLIGPTHILEIGTYTGYSAICLAEGLRPGGKLVTIDINPELEGVIREHIAEAKLQDCIQFIVGDAYQIIRTLPQTFDLVFIDADKQNYAKYFDLVIDRLNPGGLIIADNVLWSGKVIDDQARIKDKDTIALHAFNQKVNADTRVEVLMLPLRDGITLIRKKP
ncbi:MAG: O-methyltransferase [Bacteroidetes bacterium]|nr:O-methyltransferase [Bacteroidota bacterium]